MTKTELTDIIRGVVREEVRDQLPSILVEILTTKTESTRSVVAETPVRSTKPPTVVQKPKIFTKNPVLNSILNETVGGVPPEGGSGPMVLAESITEAPVSDNPAVASVQKAMFGRDYSGLLKAMDKKADGIRSRPAL